MSIQLFTCASNSSSCSSVSSSLSLSSKSTSCCTFSISLFSCSIIFCSSWNNAHLNTIISQKYSSVTILHYFEQILMADYLLESVQMSISSQLLLLAFQEYRLLPLHDAHILYPFQHRAFFWESRVPIVMQIGLNMRISRLRRNIDRGPHAGICCFLFLGDQ